MLLCRAWMECLAQTYKGREDSEVLNFSQYVEWATAALGVIWREERALRESFGE